MPSSVLDKSEQQGGERRTSPARRQAFPPSPSLQRLSHEMERLFDDFGFGRGWPGSSWRTPGGESIWAPPIDVSEKDGEIRVCADLPGLKRDDIQVQLTSEGLMISGERRREQEEEREGYYRSERRYGSFCRVVPLPEGAESDKARATFKDGVLEVDIPVSQQKAPQGRRIDIEG